MAAESGAVAAPGERHPVTTRARLEVLEVEAEDVVTLEDVRVALGDQTSARPEQLRLVHLRAGQDRAPAGGVGQGDGDDAVGLARSVGKLEARRGEHLDVQRQCA